MQSANMHMIAMLSACFSRDFCATWLKEPKKHNSIGSDPISPLINLIINVLLFPFFLKQ